MKDNERISKETERAIRGKATLAGFFLKKVVVLTFLLGTAVLGGMIWYTWSSYEGFKQAERQHVKLIELSGMITYFDEVLTMSANMAAVTGEPRWESRYQKYESRLDVALGDAREIAPEVFIKDAVSQTKAANARLVSIENEVFELVRSGELEKASVLLNSDEYNEQKQIYSDGMSKINAEIYERVMAKAEKNYWTALLTTCFLVTAMLLILVVWASARKIINRYTEERKRAEDTMRGRIEQFNLVVKGTDDGIWDWDIVTNAMYQSPRFKQLIGYEDHEIQSSYKNWESRLHPEDYDRVMQKLKEHLENLVPYECEYRLRVRTSDYKWLKGTGQAVWDKEGRAVRMVGAIHDITDRKNAEQSLKGSELKYRSIFEMAANLIVSFDRDGVIIDCNRRIKDFLSYEKEEIVGQVLEKIISPDYITRARRVLNEILICGVKYDYNCKMVRKDGEIIDVKVNAAALKDENDQYIQAVCIITDNTYHTKEIELLQKYDTNYREIFNAANDGFFVHSADDGRIIDANRKMCEMFGYTKEEIKNLSVGDISRGEAPYSQEDAIAWIQKTLSEGSQRFNWIAKSKKGKEFLAEVNLKLIEFEDKKYVLVIVQPITEDIELEKRVEQVEIISEQA